MKTLRFLLTLLSICAFTIAMAQTPVAYYPFNGNANDAIGTNNGTVNGASLTTDRFGNANSAYLFDGVDDVISYANPFTTAIDNFTISAWVRKFLITSGGQIVSNGRNPGDSFPANLYDGYSYGTGGGSLSANFHAVIAPVAGCPDQSIGWEFAVLVREAGVSKLYLNGIQCPNTFNNAPIVPTQNAFIGALNDNSVAPFEGAIDDVKIYDVSLTAEEVLAEFNENSPEPESLNSYRSAQTGNWNATSTWQRFNGTDWIAATVVPSSTDDDITIREGHTVTVNDARTIDQTVVEVGGALNLAGGMLTINDGPNTDLSVLGEFTLSSGTLNGSGQTETGMGSTFNWAGGTMDGSGDFTVSGDSEFLNTNKNLFTKTLFLQGNTTWTEGLINIGLDGNLTVGEVGTFTYNSNSELTMTNAQGGTGNFINNGTIVKSGTGNWNISGGLQFNNAGSAVINDAWINCSNSNSNHTGSFEVSSESLFLITGGTHLFDGASSSGTGFIQINGGQIQNGTELTNLARLVVFGGVVNTANPIEVSNLFRWSGGTIEGAGSFNVSGDGEFLNTNKNLFTKTLFLQGNTTWTEGLINIGLDGNLTVGEEGTFTYDSNSELTMTNAQGGTGNFINNGTIVKNGTGNWNISGGLLFSNAGNVVVNDAWINCSNSNSNHTGTFEVSSGSLFLITGGTHLFDGASSSGTGFIQINGGQIQNGTELTNLARLVVFGGVVNTANPIEVSNLFRWSGGTIEGAGSFNVSGDGEFLNTNKNLFTKTMFLQGNTTWTEGLINIGLDGNLTVDTGGTFSADSNEDLTMTNAQGGTGNFINNGTIVKNGTGNWNISGGLQFNNAGGAVINEAWINCSNSSSNHTGAFEVANGSLFLITGGTHNFDGATSTGDGFIQINGGQIQNGAELTNLARLVVFGGVVNTANPIEVSNLFRWLGGTIEGAGSFTVSGDGEFFNTNKNLFTKTLFLQGNTTWTEGLINIGLDGNLTIEEGANFIFDSDSDLPQANAQGGTGNFINNGTIVKNGTGTWTVSGTLPFINNGVISGSGGVISFSSVFTNNGTISPGTSPGILTINGVQPLSTVSTLEIEIQDNSGPGTGNDQLARSGALTLAGTLNVSEIGGVPGGTYTIIQLSSGTIDGNFNTINLPDGYSIETTSNAVILTKTADPCESTIAPVIFADETETCPGGIVILSTDEAESYLWSNGATTQTVEVGIGEYTVTTTDENGCSAVSDPVVITAVDTEAPAIPEIPNLEISTDTDACSATGVTLTPPVATDNCGITSLTNDAPEEFPLGTTVVTWTATDATGNSTTRSFNVIVSDNEAPTISAPADVIVVIGESEDFATNVELGTPEVADNCAVEGFSNDAEDSFPVGTTTVTWTVRDESGNTATATQTVTVTREILPTITAPPAITVNNDPGTCGASGIELGTPSVTGEDIPADGITNTALETYPVGTTNVVWTVIDGRGNTATAIQTVTVVDNEAPTIIAPPTVNTLTVANACESGEIDLGEPEVSDNCEIAEVSNNAPEAFPLGTSTVIWTVIDVNGNEATAEQTVIVVDEELPLITAPANITIRIEADEDSAEDVELGQPTVSDNCSIDEVSNNATSSLPVGTTIVTWTIRDGSGNEATAEQTVTVTREVLPTIAAPSDITISADAGTCAATGIDLGTPSVTGEDIPSDGISNDAPATFPVGTTIVTWNVTDGNGNTATAQQTVTVEDRENPVIAAVSEIIRSNDSGTCEAEIEITAPAVSDNCDSPIAKGTRSDGFALDAPYPVGNTQITWTATDASGNEAEEVVQTVTVEDTEAPQITAPANITIQLLVGEETSTDVELGTPTTSDNCGVAEVSNDAPTTFPVGPTTIIWTVTDVNGNTATDTQTVTVLPADTETDLPTVTAPADILVDTDKGICEANNVDLGIATFTGDIPDGGLSNDAPTS
ncbi:HYR domain-containing protein, partial [Aquiflexum lacus]|uniref:HYR domain-containing protein n=1 Tax=Aquiflexum lacus TaxID=2483805 RepID=UPI001894DEE0